jgi:hypothetical protein
MRRRPLALLLAVAATALAATSSAGAPVAPPLPHGWPKTLQIGVTDPPGDASTLAARTPVAFRYQYLAGGVNTGKGWPTWNPGGSFVTRYISESLKAHLVPVFSYYQLLQSTPSLGTDELHRDLSNLRNVATMSAYYRDFELALRRAGAFKGHLVVIHVEPDLWGYIEQQARDGQASTVPAAVASTHIAALRGLPDNASGFARALVHLRDRLAPNVALAFHLSVWGTKEDPTLSKPSLAHMGVLAARSAAFYASLHARFDLVFTDVADRDAGFDEKVNGDGGKSWWGPADYARQVAYIKGFTSRVHLGVVLWQVPLGNTILNNTWQHFQDNRVQWWLGNASDAHLAADRDAGVIAILFGGGADGTTTIDTDGGYFVKQVKAYAAGGPLALG